MTCLPGAGAGLGDGFRHAGEVFAGDDAARRRAVYVVEPVFERDVRAGDADVCGPDGYGRLPGGFAYRVLNDLDGFRGVGDDASGDAFGRQRAE